MSDLREKWATRLARTRNGPGWRYWQGPRDSPTPDDIADLLTEIDRLTAALADRDATIAELKGLLREHTDNEKCSFDHHGYCQTHSDFSIEPGDICYMERSRRAVGESETP